MDLFRTYELTIGKRKKKRERKTGHPKNKTKNRQITLKLQICTNGNNKISYYDTTVLCGSMYTISLNDMYALYYCTLTEH